MTAPIPWSEHEAWLAGLLEPLGDDAPAKPVMLCFFHDVAVFLVDARRERRDDRVDPLTELAVVAAEVAPEAVVIALPARIADLCEPGRPTVARTWQLTSATWRGGGVDLRVRQLPVGGIGRASDDDVETSPVASVLDDAVRHRLDEPLDHVLSAASRWGHTVLVARDLARSDQLASHVTEGDGLDLPVDLGAEGARHRLHRHARDLSARHRPLGGWDQLFDRPGIHASTPDGWAPACPL